MKTVDEGQLITSLVEAASKGELLELLKTLSEHSQSLACIVWEQAPVLGDHSPTDGLLFAWAQYATDSVPWRKTDIPVATSLTGLAIRSQEPQYTTNVAEDERAFRDDPWLERVGAACTFPLTIDEDHGAITFYRGKGKPPYSPREVQSYKQVAGLVPLLARSARNKIAFDLLLELDGILDKHQEDPSVDISENAVLLRVRETLQRFFRCRAVDIFVKPSQDDSDSKYYSAGTDNNLEEEIDIAKPGLPAYIAKSFSANRANNAIRVLDLLRIERDLPFLLEQYRGLTKEDLVGQMACMNELTQDLGDGALSYIAVPIASGEKLLGIVSCCGIEGEPNYFSSRELKLLDLVSSRLGRFIAHTREYRSLQREADVWRKMTSAVTSLNQLIDDSFAGSLSGKFRNSATLRIQDILKVDAADVLWSVNDNKKQAAAALSSLLGKDDLLSLKLDNNSRVRTLLDGSKLAQTHHILIAEIACKERTGVLVLGTNKPNFPLHTGSVAKILGQILGLYRFLGSKMELEREQSRVQAQAFSDLRHQIRSPILQAYRYVKQIPVIYRNDDRLLRSLNAIQGLTKRALSVAECVGFYAELARGNPPNAKLSPWPLATMRQELVEAAMDFQLLHTDKLLNFDVDRSVFDANPTAKIQADVNLFLQCVYNLLENAGKYSFRNTVVRISGTIVQKQFILTVANTGIPLTGEEAERCSQRGWRSPSVKTRMKDSGHGIGLWIVEAIMKTHAGSFSAKATNILGLTEFNLSVPLEK